MLCEKCGKLYSSGERCLYCGAPRSVHADRGGSGRAFVRDTVKKQYTVCLRCGMTVEEKTHCSVCGAPLDDDIEIEQLIFSPPNRRLKASFIITAITLFSLVVWLFVIYASEEIYSLSSVFIGIVTGALISASYVCAAKAMRFVKQNGKSKAPVIVAILLNTVLAATWTGITSLLFWTILY